MRERTFAALIVTLIAAGTVTATAQYGGSRMASAPAQPFDAHDISGFWELPIDGRRVPPAQLARGVTPAVLAAQKAKDDKALRWCNWVGMPTTMDVGRPLDIRQGMREVVILAESAVTPVRHLYLDRSTHIDKEIFDPSTSGDSIAHWDGDVLVVNTVGFDPDHGVVAIPGGGFRTANSALVERFQLLKSGTLLSVTFTWTDPGVFRAPHTYEYRYQRVEKGYEPRPYASCDPMDAGRAAFFEKAQ